ncbi:hypothetical protein C427_3872 [Paraglaciecola psychrophila 170]|uniref:Uncharacterized protein n=1 Tax=Paraglaciecola psychrophila 170 TaxID=1129794 RepID=K7AC11_9ALTE|nr:hypothetical protein C427_3872 [Paraglaciecola psychrophila 170]GAC39787.1 hypothetical protein GPSY_4176 [Paraglaciecola psychrophila 170]
MNHYYVTDIKPVTCIINFPCISSMVTRIKRRWSGSYYFLLQLNILI